MDLFTKKEIPTLEYLILLGMTVALTLIMLTSTLVPQTRDRASEVFHSVQRNIMDEEPATAFGIKLED